MTIEISSGNMLLIAFGIIFAVIVLMMLLRPGQRGKKIISIVILIVVFCVVYFMFGRPGEISISDTGVKSTVYGKIEFTWDEVRSAELVKDYQNTDWRPTIKINGSAFPGFRAGRFRLANGDMAKIVTQKSGDAVIFRTENDTYLFAVDDMDKLTEIASEHVSF